MVEEYPKVLIGTPTYEGKEYCRKRFVETVKNFTYPNADFIMVDNSVNNHYHRNLRRKGVPIVRVDRGRNSRDALANASNYLRDKVVKEDYEYLLMLESDLFPREDIIERLMDTMKIEGALSQGVRVVGAPYYIGHKPYKRLCIFGTFKEADGLLVTRCLNPGDDKQFLNGHVWNVHGMGVGCVLIHRSILERFSFWYSELDDDRMLDMPIKKHPDVYFYLDLHNAGIKVYCDSALLTEHRPSRWEDVRDV